MFVLVVVMVLILALAGLVVAYVAYPHRGEELPAVPWLGEAMARAVEAAPTLDLQEQELRGLHELRAHDELPTREHSQRASS